MSLLIPDPNMVAARAFGNPVVQGPPRNFLQKLQDGLMPRPSSGLLDEDDIKNARMQGLLGLGASLLADSGPTTAKDRVGLMQSIGRGIQGGQQAYQGAVGSALDQRMGSKMFEQQQQKHALDAAASVQQLQAGQAQQQLQAQRQALFTQNPPPADPAGYLDWARMMHGKAAGLGDLDLAEQFKTIIATQGGAQAKAQGTYVTVPGPDGKPMRRWVSQEEAAAGVPEYEKPQRDTNAELTLNSRILREQGIEKEYLKQIDDVRTTVNAYMGAKRASTMKGAGDLQILYSFIRALDPQSVVREGEIALANASASLWSRAHIWKNKIEKKGGTLSPIQRQQMLELMKQMVELKTDWADQFRQTNMDRAERYGLTVNLPDIVAKYRNFEYPKQDKTNAFGVVSGGTTTAGSGGGYDTSLDSYWNEE
jgi:hypothetical protein